MQLSLGAAKLSRDVEVAAGDTTAVEIVAGVGRLQGAIVFAEGGPAVREPFIEIFAGAQPVENEASVAYSYGNAPRFDLSAGSYRARIKADAVERTFPFEIKAGQRLDMEFALDAGIGAFEAPGATALVDPGWAGHLRRSHRYHDALCPVRQLRASGRQVRGRLRKGGAKKEAEFEVRPQANAPSGVTAALP